MTFHHTTTFTAPLERVREILTSEAFYLAVQDDREDVVKAQVEQKKRTDEQVLFDVQITQYKRTKTGGIDRSGTEDSITHYRYEANEDKVYWYHEGAEKRAKVGGYTALIPRGSRVEVERVVEIEIKIPVIGRGVAKLVEREFRKGLPRADDVLQRMLDAGS